ncbi:MAG: PilZ domain-containing protein [Kiloniellaceae bacterium]
MAASLASLAKSTTQNRREWPRYVAERPVSLAASVDGRLLPCTVADVSLGGAKLVFDEPLPAGRTIELSHPAARSVACARVWQDRHEVGIEFDFSEDSLGLISICIRNMIDPPGQSEAPAEL